MLINNIIELQTSLAGGSLTDVGGYPKYWVTKDGGTLSFDAVHDNIDLVKSAIKDSDDDSWQVQGCDINWEDAYLTCDHTGNRISSAYCEVEENA